MQPCPEEMIKGERFAFIKGVPRILLEPLTNLPGMASAAWNFPNCSLIWLR